MRDPSISAHQPIGKAPAFGPARAAGHPAPRRLAMLDGWRALSILVVLAAHLLPLGPKRWALNEPAATLGMAMFFTLSGFLIVGILLRDAAIGPFLVRRVTRIVPLYWAVLAMTLPWQSVGASTWLANFLFFANLPPFRLAPWSGHFWSLGVEMQFYVGIALVVLRGRRGLWLLPIAAGAVTALRIATGTEVSIVTWLRVGEILAGGILALVIHAPDPRWRRFLSRLPFWPVTLLAVLSAVPTLAGLDYARPYLVAAMIGITVARPVAIADLAGGRLCRFNLLRAVHRAPVHHHRLAGIGHRLGEILQTPLSFALSFAFAHISSFHFERHFIRWSHRVANHSAVRRGNGPQRPLPEVSRLAGPTL